MRTLMKSLFAMAAKAAMFTAGIALIFGATACSQKQSVIKTDIDPYRSQKLTPIKSGNLELIVSSIDQSNFTPKVLVEIVPPDYDSQLNRNQRSMFYKSLPNPNDNMLVLSQYQLEPGKYQMNFWEEATGTYEEHDVYVSKEKSYVVAFFESKMKDGMMDYEFKIRTSNMPILSEYTPHQIGQVF